jgi:hypothetical protein
VSFLCFSSSSKYWAKQIRTYPSRAVARTTGEHRGASKDEEDVDEEEDLLQVGRVSGCAESEIVDSNWRRRDVKCGVQLCCIALQKLSLCRTCCLRLAVPTLTLPCPWEAGSSPRNAPLIAPHTRA